MLRSIIDLDYTTVTGGDGSSIGHGGDRGQRIPSRSRAATIVEHGHSRLPVYVETIDEVTGHFVRTRPVGSVRESP